MLFHLKLINMMNYINMSPNIKVSIPGVNSTCLGCIVLLMSWILFLL